MSVKYPLSCASLAIVCDLTAYWSCSSRVTLNEAANLSAEKPIVSPELNSATAGN